MSHFPNLGALPIGILGAGIMAYWVFLVLLHVLLAIAVFRDGAAAQTQGRPVLLVPAPVWVLAALIAGVLGAFAYWAVNCSTLRPSSSSA